MFAYTLFSICLSLRVRGLLGMAHYSWDYAHTQEARQEIVAIGSPALPYLERAMRDQKSADWTVAEAYGQIGGAASYAHLRQLAEAEGSPPAIYAVRGLGFTKDRRALPFLLDKLNDERFRDAAAQGLGELGYAEAVPPLTELLDAGTDVGGDNFTPASLGKICAIALSKLGHPGARALADALNAPGSSAQVRRRAAEGLGLAKDAGTKIDLARFLQSDGDEEARAHAIYALAVLKDPRALPYAEKLVESEQSCDMGYACLLALGDEHSLTIAGEGIHANENRARALVWASQKCKGPDAVKVLIQMAQRPEIMLQRDAIWALNAAADPKAVPTLEALWAKAGDNKGDIEAALSKMGHPGVLALIRIYRSQPKDGKREAMLQLLGEAGDPAALPLLNEKLNDPQLWIREDARASIRRIVLRY